MAASSIRVIKRGRLPPLPTVRDLLNLYGLRALKNLSQNFLLEPKLISKIVRVAGVIENGEVCEVGPGPGGITRAILEQNPRRVIVIEKDDRFQHMLEMLADASDNKLKIISGDIMTTNMVDMFSPELKKDWEDERPNIHLIGNLPFSISTPLIIRWLKDISLRRNAWAYGRVPMTLTFQLEVAERICAPVNDEQRCRMSVMCQNYCRVKTSFTISGRAFLPPPDVDVGVVKLTPLKQPIITFPFDLVEKVVRQTFTFRQKYAHKGVGTLFPKPDMGKQMMEMADIDPMTLPYRITVKEFGRLCEAYVKICEANPALYTFNYRGRRKLSSVGMEGEPVDCDDEGEEDSDTVEKEGEQLATKESEIMGKAAPPPKETC